MNEYNELYNALIALNKYKDVFFNNPNEFIEYLFVERKQNKKDFFEFLSEIKTLSKSSKSINNLYEGIEKKYEKHLRKHTPTYDYVFETHEDFLDIFPEGKQHECKAQKNPYKNSYTRYRNLTIIINKERYYCCEKCGIFKPKWGFYMDYPNDFSVTNYYDTSGCCLSCKPKKLSKYANSIYMMENSDILSKLNEIRELEKDLFRLDDISVLELEKEEYKKVELSAIQKREIISEYTQRKESILLKIDSLQSEIHIINYSSIEERANKKEMNKLYEKFPLITVDKEDVFIYLVYYKKYNCYKIGISNNPLNRIKQFKNNFNIDNNDCEIIDVRKPICGRAVEIEKNYIHKELKHLNVKKKYPNLGVEWFDGDYKELIFEVYYKYTTNDTSESNIENIQKIIEIRKNITKEDIQKSLSKKSNIIEETQKILDENKSKKIEPEVRVSRGGNSNYFKKPWYLR